MSAPDVFQEILTWCQDLPLWQRDALRRLIESDEITSDDIEELSNFCKGSYGLGDESDGEPRPVTDQHLPTAPRRSSPTILKSLHHIEHVNALIPGEKLMFAEKGLTIIFGSNGAGKSGYARVLKSACRARGSVYIHPNLLSESPPGTPTANIDFDIEGNNTTFTWKEGIASAVELADISVFDTASASVYLKEKTDVAFRPFGLDLFDRLANVCEQIKKRLEQEKRVLENGAISPPKISENTESAKFLSKISGRTKAESVEVACRFSSEDESKLKQLGKQIQELKSSDPKQKAKELNLRSRSIQTLRSKINNINEACGTDAIEQIKEIRIEIETQKKIISETESRFQEMKVSGSGTDRWLELVRSAQKFSEESAYIGKTFPNLEADALCVLCQQPLAESARQVFEHTFSYLNDSALKTKESKESELKVLVSKIANLDTSNVAITMAIDEVEKEDAPLAKEAAAFFAETNEFIQSFDSHSTASTPPTFDVGRLEKLEMSISERVKALGSSGDAEKITHELTTKLTELEARQTLSKSKTNIEKEIDRRSKVDAYNSALRETNTRNITVKSSEITTKAVTDKLAQSFKSELERMQFTNVELELRTAGAGRGALFHQIKFKRNTNINVHDVLSEGESRALAIAAFFSELATSERTSGIIFDDPVSSLDHDWRDCVALRLVEESKDRQVVVFTHDIVFMTRLIEFAERENIDLERQYIKRLPGGAGKCGPDLPWVALKTSDRITHLKEKIPEVEKLYQSAGQDAYAKEGEYLFGLLRSAWERAVEEVLLAKVVERFRKGVETKRVRYISDIKQEDYETLEAGMSACSDWTEAHDQGSAVNAKVPPPETLRTEITRLENWAKEIRRRRKNN